MPKAVRFDGYGGIDVLHVDEVPRPVPGAVWSRRATVPMTITKDTGVVLLPEIGTSISASLSRSQFLAAPEFSGASVSESVSVSGYRRLQRLLRENRPVSI